MNGYYGFLQVINSRNFSGQVLQPLDKAVKTDSTRPDLLLLCALYSSFHLPQSDRIKHMKPKVSVFHTCIVMLSA